MGGLSRRAYQIKEIQKTEKKSIILLDGGSLFFAKPEIAGSLLEAQKIQARGISSSMQKMHYSGIGIGPLDLAAGLDFLLQQEKEFSLPLLSANLLDAQTNTPILRPFLIKQAGKTSLGIIGLTAPPRQAGSTGKKYRIAEWPDVLTPLLQKVQKQADMIILLSSYPESVNRQIAKRFPDVHLIIQSGHSGANKVPKLVNNTLVTQIGSRGKYAGRIDIDWSTSRRWQQDISPRLKQEKERLDRINWRLGRMVKEAQGKSLHENKIYKSLLLERDGSTAEIARLKKLTEDDQSRHSSFSNTFIPLKVALPEDPEIREIVLQTKAAINSAGRRNLERLRQSTLPDKGGIRVTMAGWKQCRSCHPAQTDFWQTTRHAGAWQTLENVKQQFNRKCQVCHVTLPTYDMETVHTEDLLANLPPEFYGVSCEACHGPGKAHAENPAENRPRRPDINTCRSCHAMDHDTSFAYEQKVKLIRCPASH